MASTTVGASKKLYYFGVGNDVGWDFNSGLQLEIPASGIGTTGFRKARHIIIICNNTTINRWFIHYQLAIQHGVMIFGKARDIAITCNNTSRNQ